MTLARGKAGKELKLLPVTEKTDQDLTTNNTNNLEIGNGIRPLLIAGFVGLPTRWPNSLEKREQITDREKNVTGESLDFIRSWLASYK